MGKGKLSEKQLHNAAEAIKISKYAVAFTGAGISVESGIPPFRGENGLWNKYDPEVLNVSYFYQHPEESWKVIKEIFYEHFGKAEPNEAHKVLSQLEQRDIIKFIITQNIDNLHHKAGSKRIAEFHGNSRKLICIECGKIYSVTEEIIAHIPPRCECRGILKPDFIFFGEGIPKEAFEKSRQAAEMVDVMILIGTTGEVYPASMLPRMAAERGAYIIEINPTESLYTDSITDIFLKEKAATAMQAVIETIDNIT